MVTKDGSRNEFMSFQATSELNFSRRHEIEGRFIKVSIKCSQDNVINGNVLSTEASSCVVLKITGNITRKLSNWMSSLRLS